MNFIESCRRFIAIDSTPDSGTREVALFAAELCRNIGLNVTLQEEILFGVPQINIIARQSSEIQEDEVMLLSHLDTVDPGPYGLWKKTEGNPFNASIYGQAICGLGVRTGKLDFLCKLEAIKNLIESGPWRRPFVLVGTFGNHLGMAGALKLVRRKMVNASATCIGEPTGLIVADGGSGFAKLEITIPFSEAERVYHREHDLMESSSTQSKMFRTKKSEDSGKAENAIFKMFDYLEKLPQGIAIMDIDGGVGHNIQPLSAVVEMDMVDTFKEGVISKLLLIRNEIKKLSDEFKLHPDNRFEKQFSTINVGRIYKQNQYVHILGSCRLLPSVSSSTYENWLEKLGKACREIGATFKILDYKRPFSTEESSSFLKSALQTQSELYGEEKAIKLVLGTEASIFERLETMDCIVFGAGKVDEEYSVPDESVSLEDLQKSIQFYQKLIERVCI